VRTLAYWALGLGFLVSIAAYGGWLRVLGPSLMGTAVVIGSVALLGGGAVLGGYYDRPNAPLAPVKAFTKSDFINGLFDPSIFPVPALGQTGNLGRDTFRGPHFRSVDITLARGFSLGEGRSIQFRAEGYNVLNNVNLYLPNVDLSLALKADGTYSTKSIFGKSTRAFDARILQLGLKLVF